MKNLKYLKCGQAIRRGKETKPGIEQVRKPMVVLAVLVGLSLAASVGVQVQGTCAEMQVLGTFPHHDIGSIKLYKDTQSGTQALGNDPFQIRYGKRRAWKGIPPRDVVYFLFPGSRKQGEMITKELIEQEGRRLLEKFGGEDRLRACAREM